MKKAILILGLCLITAGISFAGNKCTYTCVTPYDMNNKFSTVISKITGLNLAGTKISENIVKKSIAKNIQGKDLKVDIDSYSAKDLKNGIFKSMKIKGNNVIVNEIYLSEFELKSLCDFNYIKYDKSGNINFKEDYPMSFKFRMNADDINKSMQSKKYQKIINDVNKIGLGGLKVSSTEVSIRGNKFYYIVNVAIPFVKKEQKIEITADIDIKDGKIDFGNTRLASNSFKLDLKKIDGLMNYLNPLDFSVNIFDNKNANIGIKNIAIKNNEIVADGVVVIPKD